MIYTIPLQTHNHEQMIDITGRVRDFVTQSDVGDGLAVIYCPHTTAGITINENADRDVQRDFLQRLDTLYPWHCAQDRHGEGNSAAHLKASTIGASQTVIIQHGRLLLGQWQGIYFCEFDGPRSRTCYVKVL